MLVTLKEYADKNNVTYGYIRKAICEGKLIPDTKIKNQWYIDDERPWFTKRTKINKKMYGNKAMSYSRIYNIWKGMKQRCYNPNHNKYPFYGGRGVDVCEKWKEDSGAFIDWAYSHGYNDNLEIDRIDSEKGYCPDNCRWITRSENARRSKPPYYYDKDGKMKKQAFINRFIKEYGESPEGFS